MVSFATALVMRSLNRSVGATVKRCGSAFSIWKLRSGIRFLSNHRGPLLQSVEEMADLLPDLGSAGKASPVGANQAYQLVTVVDREHIVLRSSKPPNSSNPVDEQSFNVRFHFLQPWIGVLDFLPGLQRQQRLSRPRRAWIKSDNPCIRRALEEESHADRNHQALPLAVGETKVCQAEYASRNSLIFRPGPAE